MTDTATLNEIALDLTLRGRDLCSLARLVAMHTIHDNRSGEMSLRIDSYAPGLTVAELTLCTQDESVKLTVIGKGNGRDAAITALVQKLIDGAENLCLARRREGEGPQ